MRRYSLRSPAGGSCPGGTKDPGAAVSLLAMIISASVIVDAITMIIT